MSEQNQATPVVPPGTRGVKQELTLSDGTAVVVYRGKTKHLRDAGRVADITKETPLGYQLALVSLLCTFNGRMLTYEDVLELDLEDGQLLMGAVSGKGAAAASASSLPLSTSPS